MRDPACDHHRGRGEILTARLAVACLAMAAGVAGLGSAARAQTPRQAEVLETPGEAPEHTTLVYPPFAHTLGIHRARPMHLKLFLGGRTVFSEPQGLAAVKFAADDDPAVRSDDYQLTLFGVNAGRGEILYNSTMQTLAIFGRKGSGEGMFLAPRGITAHPDGRIYVADTGNRRVVRLRWDAIGRRVTWAGTWSARAPYDVAVDQRGNVFVADRDAAAVLRFADSTSGAGTAFLPPSPIAGDRWPLPADTGDPVAIAIGDSLDPWYAPKHYQLFVVDRGGDRLRAVDAHGRVVAEAPSGSGRFAYLAVDFHGNVYATDTARGAIVKFDPSLSVLDVFTGPGDPASALDQPRGIALWRRFGQVFVAEREGAQYFFVGTDFLPAEGPLAVTRSAGRWGFTLFLTEAAGVKAAFLDAAGDTLATVAPVRPFPAGEQRVAWTDAGWARRPPEGWEARAVAIVVEARPTYSSRRRFARVRSYTIAWNSGS